jgi:hypothetical protein
MMIKNIYDPEEGEYRLLCTRKRARGMKRGTSPGRSFVVFLLFHGGTLQIYLKQVHE